MSKKEKWFKLALYDLETARVMFETGRYRYVPFMCQQAIEKVLKGMISEKLNPPRIHDLVRLAELAEIKFTNDDLLMLEKISSLYVRMRYFPTESISRFSAEEYLMFTEELCQKFLKRIE